MVDRVLRVLGLCLFFMSSVRAQELSDAYVHHVVLFGLNDDVTLEQVAEFIEVGERDLARIPGVTEVSINKSARTDRAVHLKEYDLALYVRWKNNAVGDVYGPHVLHKSFVQKFRSLISTIRVIDFYGK